MHNMQDFALFYAFYAKAMNIGCNGNHLERRRFASMPQMKGRNLCSINIFVPNAILTERKASFTLNIEGGSIS